MIMELFLIKSDSRNGCDRIFGHIVIVSLWQKYPFLEVSKLANRSRKRTELPSVYQCDRDTNNIGFACPCCYDPPFGGQPRSPLLVALSIDNHLEMGHCTKGKE